MIRVYGYLGHITQALRDDVARADVVVGGKRHLDAADVPRQLRVELGPLESAIQRLLALNSDELGIVIASGDPGFFGILRSLRTAGLDCEVIPAPSSLQAAFGAMGLPWDDAQLVSAHSGGIDAAVRSARVHPKVGVLTAPGAGIVELAGELVGSGKHYVLAEQLGTPEQRVRVFTEKQAQALQAGYIKQPNVVLIMDHAPTQHEGIGNTPQLAGDACAPSINDPRPGSNRRPDGSDREPIIGQIATTTRSGHNADTIDQKLAITSKRYGGPASKSLVAAWSECDVIISHLALGATMRLIAPLLCDKHSDPGVVVVDEAGKFAVPLAGGHIGGANNVARAVADALGGTAVISTATDSLGIPALDQLGWQVDGDVAGVTTAIIEGKPVELLRAESWPIPPMPANVAVVTGPAVLKPAEETVGRIMVTDFDMQPDDAMPTVVLHPDSLVVGMGCNKETPVDSLRVLLTDTMASAGLAMGSIKALTSADVKAGERGLIKLAAELGVSYITFPEAELAAQQVPNLSARVAEEIGTASVAEASVQAFGAALVVQKHKSAEATCAVGRMPGRGCLHVVGLGPGVRDLLTPRAAEVIRQANLVIGYGPYVRQIRDLVSPYATVRASKMGSEEDRTRVAINAAREGKNVAFVCGGDPAIYAMASPTLEMGTDGIDVDIVPGVTAELAASAILGAPLGHDHATISLSDLHTDWDLIRQRVQAAAAGDFVITFYNPRSRTRLHQLPDALAIVAEHRGPDTPVASVSQAERTRQKVCLSTLADFRPEWVDMNTIVVVGSSTTKCVASGDGRKLMVTPRDYHWMAGEISSDVKLNFKRGERTRVSRAEFTGKAGLSHVAGSDTTDAAQTAGVEAGVGDKDAEHGK